MLYELTKRVIMQAPLEQRLAGGSAVSEVGPAPSQPGYLSWFFIPYNYLLTLRTHGEVGFGRFHADDVEPEAVGKARYKTSWKSGYCMVRY